MIDAVDVTPLMNPIVRWEEQWRAPSAPPNRALVVTAGGPPTGASMPRDRRNFDLFATAPGVTAPTTLAQAVTQTRQSSASPAPHSTVPSAPVIQSALDSLAQQRIRLLATKYVNDSVSREVLARLEILNRRLLDLSPRVTTEQVVALEKAFDELETIRSRRAERLKRQNVPG